jgi:hypothetical protein
MVAKELLIYVLSSRYGEELGLTVPKTAALKVNSAGLMSSRRHLWARVSRTTWPPSIRAR